jgi:putative DNA primase/helicase
MLAAPRGIGKTFFALSVAYAAASGGSFLGFDAPTPRRVLYIDGEMPASAMQERIASIIKGFGIELPDPSYFRILASDLTQDGLPDLSSPEGQEEIDEHIGNAELIILDNLSTLVRSGKENEAESWSPIQNWILQHRRAGRSVLLIHHAVKNGIQRGTSKREDVLDTVIALKRPQDYASEQGARFEVNFEKSRGFHGEEAQSFEAQFELTEGRAHWSRKTIDDVEYMRVIDALNSGLSIREAVEECGTSKSKVERYKKRGITEGKYPIK